MNTYYLITGLMIVAGFFLILIVLVQNSKGGGLASNFAGNNQIMGVRRTADWLEKTTWTLAIAILAFSLLSVISIPKGEAMMQNSQVNTEGVATPMPQKGAPAQQQNGGATQTENGTQK